MLSIIVLNFSTSKVQKNFYNNILLKCEKFWNIISRSFFLVVIWQLRTFFIPMFYTVIFMFLKLIFIVPVALILYMYVKLIVL